MKTQKAAESGRIGDLLTAARLLKIPKAAKVTTVTKPGSRGVFQKICGTPGEGAPPQTSEVQKLSAN